MFQNLRDEIYKNLFEAKNKDTYQKILLFKSNFEIFLALSTILSDERRASVKQDRDRLKLELTFIRLFQLLKSPFKCKICLTNVHIWALFEHSKNCFSVNYQKKNLDKINDKILFCCEELKEIAKGIDYLVSNNNSFDRSRFLKKDVSFSPFG